MASSLPSFCSLSKPLCKHKIRKYPLQLIISQSFRDEGNPTNIVDANLRVLRERIEALRRKERSNTSCRLDNGWTYKSGYIDKKHNININAILSNSIEVVGLISTALGLVFLTGSLSIFLVSFLVHFYA